MYCNVLLFLLLNKNNLIHDNVILIKQIFTITIPQHTTSIYKSTLK